MYTLAIISGFYYPEKLNPSYSRWISQLARLDRELPWQPLQMQSLLLKGSTARLLKLLQYAKAGEYVYGQMPSKKVRSPTN